MSRSDYKRPAEAWLRDVVLWGEMLERCVAGHSGETFAEDEKTRNAASKCIESIGEAARRLLGSGLLSGNEAFAAELRRASAARNRLAHGYHSIDWAVVWKAATESVPPLVAEARRLLADPTDRTPR